ncbi:phosphopantetheinyl transferase [Hypoxylon sp. NC1633]|nr:phosphopantetheinyl transferase [Hypoxylon sp. NC1633]
MGSDNVKVIQCLVDTRGLWPKATKTKDLENEAASAMDLLTEDEKTAVLRYYFVADARMSLASHLLKRWVVSKHAGVAWWEARLSRDANKKPIFVDAASGRQPVAFNVSHQAGLVALVAVAGYDGPGAVDVGTDVVCTSERRARDHRIVAGEGWDKFVDMHADVFGRSEGAYLKSDGLLLGASSQQQQQGAALVDAKLRAFYTLWCLREAYVKMTGEALLAPWLKDLEFRGFTAPAPGASSFTQEGQPDEQVIRDFEVVFRSERVGDANLCLRALGPDYMTCSAVRTPGRREDALGWELGPYRFLSVEEIVRHAEATMGV